jgi:hypothetical protein
VSNRSRLTAMGVRWSSMQFGAMPNVKGHQLREDAPPIYETPFGVSYRCYRNAAEFAPLPLICRCSREESAVPLHNHFDIAHIR